MKKKSKVKYVRKIEEILSYVLTYQTVQTVKFMFSNVALIWKTNCEIAIPEL